MFLFRWHIFVHIHSNHYSQDNYRSHNKELPIWIIPHHRIISAIREHIESDEVAVGVYRTVRIKESAYIGIVISAVEVVEARLGFVLLCPPGGVVPSGVAPFRRLPTETKCCLPAIIAFVIPQRQNLSGVLLKPLRELDYPNNLPFVLKRRCLLR